jgi:predicted transcriptional regulator
MPRPKGSVKPIDLKQVEALASMGLTQDEIAAVVGCTSRTLRARADTRAALTIGGHKIRASIRRWQYEKAKEGNVAMLIWLGKQLLGQRERIDQEIREETIIIEPIPKSGTDA